MATRSAGHPRFFDFQTRLDATLDPYGMPPLPEVVEDDSDAAWALWRDAANATGGWESDTQPMGLLPE